MFDDTTREALRQFVTERGWEKFHTPENLAKSVSIEAAELLECFQWGEPNLDEVKDELADVLIYCLHLAGKLDLDPEQIILDKLEKSGRKYPVELQNGRIVKNG